MGIILFCVFLWRKFSFRKLGTFFYCFLESCAKQKQKTIRHSLSMHLSRVNVFCSQLISKSLLNSRPRREENKSCTTTFCSRSLYRDDFADFQIKTNYELNVMKVNALELCT